jgi:hypothetical protein
MAFSLTATVGSTTVNLSNRSPFAFRTLRGAGGVDIRRVTIQGPAQDGDTDRGYRLGPRDLELVVVFTATTDALLDGYRDTLTQFFKPLVSTPVGLTMTLDNGNVRQLDVYPRGESPVKITLTPELRPSHTHQAIISLRAPDPAWYNPTQGSISVVGTSLTAAQWYYAGGAIGSAQAVEFGTAPTQGQVWTYAGTPGTVSSYELQTGGGYTVAFRSGKEAVTAGKYAFFAGSASGTPSASFSTNGTIGYALGIDHVGAHEYGGLSAGTSFMPASGTNNYFVSMKTYVEGSGYVEAGAQRGTASFNSGFSGQDIVPTTEYNIGGTVRRWRSNGANDAASRWTEALTRYAVYVPALLPDQISALNTYMSLSDSSTDAQTLPIAYNGNLPEYPTISITGPVTNPSVTNLTTSETLDFGTITIGAGTTYIINTHPQYRTVYAGTVNKRRELSQDSDLDSFHISPSAVGGTNVFYLNGTAMGTATQFQVLWYDRYTSF